MIKPLLLLPLIAQISVAPSIGDGNIAPAIGEKPKPTVPQPEIIEPKPEPVAVQTKVPAAPTSDPAVPIEIPVPAPPAETSVNLAPPLEQSPVVPAHQTWGNPPPVPQERPRDALLPQGQPPQPSHEGNLQPPSPQPWASPQPPATAYRQQTPVQSPPQFTDETIGYPLTAQFPVTSPFGWRNHPVQGGKRLHTGVDLGAPHGTPTLAMLSGRVLHADWEGSYGKSVVLEHPGTGLKTRYAHLSQIHVQPGQWVDKGWHIGDSGATGLVTGPHAHIEMIEGGKHIDPWPYLIPFTALKPRFHAWAG